MLILAVLSAVVWLVLLLARDGFWRADQRLGAEPLPPPDWPEVVVLVPARDEAGTVGRVLEAHAASSYPGRLSVILADDGSADGTGAIARRVAAQSARPARVIEAPSLASGWSGKLWALEAARRAAATAAPEARYLLLTDADIVLAPDTLTRLVTKAEAQGLALVSLMARLDARGFWGGLLIPAFVFFFQKLYPFSRINDAGCDVAGAAGGCILIRREAIEEIGGFGAIRGALIDDCALARRVKLGPPRRAIWLGLAEDEAVSLRDNRRLASIWTMVARTAFTQLRHSALLLAGTVAAMALTYQAGPLAALTLPLHGDPLAAGAGALAWGMAGFAYRPTLRLYGRSAWQAAGLPLAALLYSAMTLGSAVNHWRGCGGAWKGRSY